MQAFLLSFFHIQLLPHTKTIDLRVEKWAKMPGVIPFYPKHGFMIKYCLSGKKWKEGAIHAIEGVSHTTRHVWWQNLLILKYDSMSQYTWNPGTQVSTQRKVQLHYGNKLFEFLSCARHNIKDLTYIFSANPHNNSMKSVPLLISSCSWVLESVRREQGAPGDEWQVSKNPRTGRSTVRFSLLHTSEVLDWPLTFNVSGVAWNVWFSVFFLFKISLSYFFWSAVISTVLLIYILTILT